MLLPPTVRRLVEDRFGTTVVEAHSAGAGYTPGLASVLVGANGTRMFLKAASKKAQRPFAAAYAEEIRKLRSLPSGLPIPRLLWSHEDDLWVLLALEYVDGVNPARPWADSELEACLDTLQKLAQTLTPPPVPLSTLRGRLRGHGGVLGPRARGRRPTGRTSRRPRPWRPTAVRVTAGNTVVHTDARDDNFVLTPGGAAFLCDWNFPVRWRGLDRHGVPADDGVRRRSRRRRPAGASGALTRKVDPDHVDSLLALLCGYFLERRDQPSPYSSPYLRRHQDWCAEVSWAWLAQRRGWS